MIQLEKRGLVDFEVAGHVCQRPAEVCEGATADRLLGFQPSWFQSSSQVRCQLEGGDQHGLAAVCGPVEERAGEVGRFILQRLIVGEPSVVAGMVRGLLEITGI